MSLTDPMGGAGGAGGSSAVGVRHGSSGGEGIRASAARHSLLPLRLFLGATFLYAGIDKITGSAFLSGSGNGSLTQVLEAVQGSAAAPWMVDLALKNPEGFGYAISVGEMAVGLGTLLGLWTRLAALGGALISLSFWLTITWATEPYYYGNDLAYLMAWTPLILAGAPILSLDSVLAARRRRKGRQIFG